MSGKTKLTEYIKRRPSDDCIKSFGEICESYWSSFVSSFEDIQKYTTAEPNSTPYRNRDGGNLLFRPVALLPFIKATVKVLSVRGKTATDTFALYPKSLLQISNKIWQNVVWNSDKKTMIMNNKTLTEHIMLYYMDRDLLTSKNIADMKNDLKFLKQLSSIL